MDTSTGLTQNGSKQGDMNMQEQKKTGLLRDLINAKPNAERLRAMEQVVGFSQGGVFKRIDENRELLELLQSNCPEFLAQNFWIEGWLCSQDEFLTGLAEVSTAENPFSKLPHGPPFPRPWPGTPADNT